MTTTIESSFAPLVTGATTSQSPNVRSVMDCLDDQTYYVPEYQRDSSQWDIPKKSLFMESLINNLTIPPLIAYPETDSGRERWQIVDGQQRLTTIREFMHDGFALAKESDGAPERTCRGGGCGPARRLRQHIELQRVARLQRELRSRSRRQP